jgi:pimeloyl-ACP methyl ester carboxylesterase
MRDDGQDERGAGHSRPSVEGIATAGARTAWFWAGVSIPTTPAASRRFARKVADYARRCGQLSGSLLRHLANADMARDLDYLRRLVGDRQLNYYGVSYGTFLGQTYANMFPRRMRAMAIDGNIDTVAYTKGAEPAVAAESLDSDRVFEDFQSHCQSAGRERCALAGHGPVAARVDALIRRLRRAPIPASSANPPGELTYGELLNELFNLLGHGPDTWPQLAQELDQAANGDASALLTGPDRHSTSFGRARTVTGRARTVTGSRQSGARTARPGSGCRPGRRSSVGSRPPATRADPSWVGTPGGRARPGPRTAPILIPAPGLPPPRTRSWSWASALTPTLRLPTPAGWHAYSATRSC